ncbi:MAG: energy-coupling factor transporter transmembrane protein EcfT, partial [Clostridia bacterium]|nr:energy-coupling factor transporter transmembrane protein EcfT [Clostridia bacterium]
MQNNISIGQYFPGDSFVHRLDPRTKILFSLLFIVCIFLSKGFLCFLMIALFAFMCMKVSKISMKFIIKGLKPIMFIVLFTFMLNLFLSSGEDVIVKFGVISITFSGIRNAVFMAIRLILLVTCTQLLTLTTSPIQLTDGIERLLSPLKRIGFPAHELAMMMSIALRFIPTLIE